MSGLSFGDRIRLASDATTPAEVLARLAGDAKTWVRDVALYNLVTHTTHE